jgi:hypothetical protein
MEWSSEALPPNDQQFASPQPQAAEPGLDFSSPAAAGSASQENPVPVFLFQASDVLSGSTAGDTTASTHNMAGRGTSRRHRGHVGGGVTGQHTAPLFKEDEPNHDAAYLRRVFREVDMASAAESVLPVKAEHTAGTGVAAAAQVANAASAHAQGVGSPQKPVSAPTAGAAPTPASAAPGSTTAICPGHLRKAPWCLQARQQRRVIRHRAPRARAIRLPHFRSPLVLPRQLPQCQLGLQTQRPCQMPVPRAPFQPRRTQQAPQQALQAARSGPQLRFRNHSTSAPRRAHLCLQQLLQAHMLLAPMAVQLAAL